MLRRPFVHYCHEQECSDAYTKNDLSPMDVCSIGLKPLSNTGRKNTCLTYKSIMQKGILYVIIRSAG